jgi:hypothetical protein
MRKLILLFLSISFLYFVPVIYAQSNSTPEPAKINIKLPSPSPIPEALTLKSISPDSADFEEKFTIRGTGFGSTPSYVIFKHPTAGWSVGAPILSWENHKIKARVPAVSPDIEYIVWVEKPDGAKSNTTQFKVKRGQPRIDNLTPSTTQPNGTWVIDDDEKITLTGEDLGRFKGRLNLYFNNTPLFADRLKVVSWSETQVVFTVPKKVSHNQEYGLQVETSDGRHSSFKFIYITD